MMPRSVRVAGCLLAGSIALAATPRPAAAAAAIAAELRGQLRIGAGPAIDWRIDGGQTGNSGELRLIGRAEGLEAEARLTLPSGDEPGRWRTDRVAADLAAWGSAVVSGLSGGASPGLSPSGRLQVEGGGSWRGGEVEGLWRATIAEGGVRAADGSWEILGGAMQADGSVRAGKPGLGSARLTAREAIGAGVRAENIEVEAAGGEDGAIEVRRAAFALWGGRFQVTSFRAQFGQPFQTSAEFTGVDLAQLAVLVPNALASAEGRVDGRIEFSWSEEAGFRIRGGEVHSPPGRPVVLRLAPKPGFLTRTVPPKIALLPSWLGSLARRPELMMDNPAWLALRAIEMGELPLSAPQGISIALYPDGPEGSRSARVEVAAVSAGARSASEDATLFRVDRPQANVSFSVNVDGPLDEVLRLGFDDRASMEIAPAAE